MKTSRLIGVMLDWAVSKCEGRHGQAYLKDGRLYDPLFEMHVEFSADWAQGGPIIEREEIEISRYWNRERIHHEAWKARIGNSYRCGSTPLIAAMRCYVASKLGEEVEVPEELL